MEKDKCNKRALWASGLSLLICCAMLIGTTFAWFTDSVVNAGNIIKSGNLDVTMEWADGTKPLDTADWKDASAGAIFDYDLWEPGYTEVRHVKISNVGSLALKYEISIAATGEVSDLTDVIDVYYIKGGRQIANRSDLTDAVKIGTLADVLEKPYAAKGHLSGKNDSTVDADIATIALKMQETAGNEYQGRSIGSSFAIQLVATQYTYEQDGFGSSDYDEDAQYPVIEVSGADDISETIANAPTGSIVNLTEDITLPAGDSLVISQKDIFINLKGNTLTIEQSGLRPISVEAGASLEIYGNGKLYTDTATACIENSGTLTLKNITVENSGNTAIRNDYGTMTIEGCEITSEFYGINNYSGIIESIKNSSIHVLGNGPCAIYNAGTSTIREIRDTTITAATTASLFAERAVYNSANSVVKNIVNCSIDGKFDLAGNNISITSGTFKNTKLEREAFEALVQEGCKITEIENGYQVTAE